VQRYGREAAHRASLSAVAETCSEYRAKKPTGRQKNRQTPPKTATMVGVGNNGGKQVSK